MPAALATLAGDLHGGSLVLLDAGSAECIASAAGIKLLSDMGAVSVANLSSTSLHRDVAAAAALTGSGRLSSLTILISTMLAPAEARIIAASRAAMAYTSHIVVACAVSEIGHYDEVQSLYSPTCYSDFCTALRQQLQPKSQLDITAKLCPLLTIPLSESAFVLPVAGAAAGAVMSNGRPLGYVAAVQTAADSEDEEEEQQGDARSTGAGKQGKGRDGEKAHGVAVLAHALSSIASSLGVRPEAFCLGPAAVAVGKSLAFVASEDAPPAAFVLVDRAADLATPLMHADVLMQKAWESLRYDNSAETGLERGDGDARGVDLGNINIKYSGWEDEEMVQLGRGHVVPGLFTPAHVPVPMPSIQRQPATGDATLSTTPAAAAEISGGGEINFSSFLPGSLFHPSDAQTTSHLGFLLTRPGKDAAMFVRKWLREAARKEGMPAAALRSKLGAGGVITARELRSLAAVIASYSPESEIRNAPLLQLAEAAALALEDTVKSKPENCSSSSVWDALRREEHFLELACSEGSDPACEQLVDLFIAAGRAGPVGLPEAVGLLLLAYQVLPDHLPWYADGGVSGANISVFTAEHEARLRSSIADAIVACSSRWVDSAEPERVARKDAPWLAPLLVQRLVHSASNISSGEDAGERRALHLEVRDAVSELLRRMQELSFIKQRAQQGFRQTIGSGGGASSGDWNEGFNVDKGASESYSSSLLVRLASAISGRREIKGLKHSSTSLAGLLKSGLGRFGLQKQPQPGDYPLVVIFVVGGVSISEIHQVLACVDAKAVAAAAVQAGGNGGGEVGVGQEASGAGAPPPKVIVGGTALLQPRDIVFHALATN